MNWLTYDNATSHVKFGSNHGDARILGLRFYVVDPITPLNSKPFLLSNLTFHYLVPTMKML